MKNIFKLLIFFLSVQLFSACQFQKRYHNPGYSISFLNAKAGPKQARDKQKIASILYHNTFSWKDEIRRFSTPNLSLAFFGKTHSDSLIETKSAECDTLFLSNTDKILAKDVYLDEEKVFFKMCDENEDNTSRVYKLAYKLMDSIAFYDGQKKRFGVKETASKSLDMNDSKNSVECDTLITNDGKRILVKNIEYNEDILYYNRCESVSEYKYRLHFSQIRNVLHANGSKSQFNDVGSLETIEEKDEPFEIHAPFAAGVVSSFLAAISLLLEFELAIAVAVFALIFSIWGLSKPKNNGFAVVGLVLSFFILITALLIFLG